MYCGIKMSFSFCVFLMGQLGNLKLSEMYDLHFYWELLIKDQPFNSLPHPLGISQASSYTLCSSPL